METDLNAKDQITAALVKVQAILEPAAKSKVNPFYHSKYADLEGIMAVVRKPLAENGLAITQTLETVDGKIMLVTSLLHVSGQFLRGIFPVAPAPTFDKEGKEHPPTPQAWGSAQTYARRYGLAALVGITVEDDDDGNAASAKNSNGKAAVTAAKIAAVVPNRASVEQQQEVRALAKMVIGDVKDAIAQAKKAAGLPVEPLSEENAVKLIAYLKSVTAEKA